MAIRAPLEDGDQYADVCPGLGVGAYNLVERTEEVVVGEVTYTAEGFEVQESEAWLGEFLSFSLADGTSVTFGGFDMSFEAYVAVKEVLLQIVASYRP